MTVEIKKRVKPIACMNSVAVPGFPTLIGTSDETGILTWQWRHLEGFRCKAQTVSI